MHFISPYDHIKARWQLAGYVVGLATIGIFAWKGCQNARKDERNNFYKENGFDVSQVDNNLALRSLGDTAVDVRHQDAKNLNTYKIFDFKNQKVHIQNIVQYSKKSGKTTRYWDVTENLDVSMEEYKSGLYIDRDSNLKELNQELEIAKQWRQDKLQNN